MDRTIPPFGAHLLDFIGGIEAPRGYDTVYGNNQGKLSKRVTAMTIAEIQKAQAGWSKKFGSSATGRYQFMQATLAGLIEELGLDTSAKFDANMQDRLGFHLLQRRGYDRFVAGRIGLTAFAKALAQEWASLPVLATTKGAHRQVKRGQSYYAGDGLNKSLVAPERVEAALKVNLPGKAGEVAKTTAAPIVETAPVPVQTAKPRIWATLWGAVFGKDAKAATAPVEVDPATTQILQVQKLLSAKGYVEVGQPDGLDGPKTRGAIRDFRAENDLPAGDAIDDKLIAALAAAGPRQVSKARVEATAEDLRAKGNTQVATLDGFGVLGKILGIGGVAGGIAESGVLDQASGALSSVQDTFGTIATILTTIISVVQWCVSHWWLFAIGAGLYLMFRVATAVLNLVVLFRQGFLARADK